MNLQKSVFLGMLAAVSLAFLAVIQDFSAFAEKCREHLWTGL